MRITRRDLLSLLIGLAIELVCGLLVGAFCVLAVRMVTTKRQDMVARVFLSMVSLIVVGAWLTIYIRDTSFFFRKIGPALAAERVSYAKTGRYERPVPDDDPSRMSGSVEADALHFQLYYRPYTFKAWHVGRVNSQEFGPIGYVATQCDIGGPCDDFLSRQPVWRNFYPNPWITIVLHLDPILVIVLSTVILAIPLRGAFSQPLQTTESGKA